MHLTHSLNTVIIAFMHIKFFFDSLFQRQPRVVLDILDLIVIKRICGCSVMEEHRQTGTRTRLPFRANVPIASSLMPEYLDISAAFELNRDLLE
jgi:hypothetical protein